MAPTDRADLHAAASCARRMKRADHDSSVHTQTCNVDDANMHANCSHCETHCEKPVNLAELAGHTDWYLCQRDRLYDESLSETQSVASSSSIGSDATPGPPGACTGVSDHERVSRAHVRSIGNRASSYGTNSEVRRTAPLEHTLCLQQPL